MFCLLVGRSKCNVRALPFANVIFSFRKMKKYNEKFAAMAVTARHRPLYFFKCVLKKCDKHFAVSIIISTFAPQLRTVA